MALGFAAGYYLGTMAGRERFDQINEMLHKAQQSSAIDQARSKAKPIVNRVRGQAPDDESGNGAAAAAEAAVE